MRAFLMPAFAIALGAGFFAAPEAQARFNAAHIAPPSLVDQAQCVTRQVRTVHPNGRVSYRTIRDCGVHRGWYGAERCRVVRERIYRPNGSVVTRSIRRCG